ncbi:hypothetical protein TRFO_15084 [Tritrichomonas foetus]|uniref:Right handed beta helix domain-containing protein n=1 Tax=Tritrichomonas foetus TaxID=1144522 RepID=A0A1J4KTD5_9EUKA|nr:hypothetical protein TRFO_15084 [Tritrichomonas foetus]|eukprot:OHT14545.1 hypothetical protein TRFO_15084 [Tritrichomonas foetus]
MFLTIVFNNCFFINNSAGEKGGALCFTVPVHFLFCQFDGNEAKFGGALAFEIQRSCSIQYCKFYNNTAREKGGALYISYSSSARDGLEEFEFVGCDFEGNTGKESHCIYIQRSEVTLRIHSCNFFNNFFTETFQSGSCVVSEAAETIVTFCVFKNDNFTKACGGINVTRKSILNVTNCLFEKCHAGNIDKYGGGGIAYCNKTSGDNEDIYIKDCVFRNNTGCNGVAILLQPTSSYPHIEKCTIEYHENTKYIFCIFFIMETDGHDFVIQECNFYNNSHANSQDTFVGANGIWIAEAERPVIIDNDNQMNLVFRDCEFKDSHAPGFGGAFYYGLSPRLQGVELTFDHCDFVGNSCDRENGGCIYIYTMRPVSILYCTFENNEAKAVGASSNAAGGGAIFLHKSVSELIIFNCTFHNCRASTGSYIYANGDSMDSINISKCLFSNIPDKQNNSIYIKLPLKNDHFEFNENIFDSLHCTGTNGGSGLHIKAEKDYELKSCQFIDCYYNGKKENGMFYIGESSDTLLTLFNCTFEEKNGVSEETNRAVWIEQEQGLELVQCTFKNFWKVDRTGAALLSKSQTKSNSFYNCTFENLIGWSCIHFEHCKEIDLELCKFTNVTVGGFTGIIYNNESEEFHLLNCTFTECGGSNKPTRQQVI